MNETNRSRLSEIIQSACPGQYMTINGYANKYGEVSDYLVHADANYESVHTRSLAKLQELYKDKSLKINIIRHVWVDTDGNEHTRKAAGRVLTKKDEVVSMGDPDLEDAFAMLEKQITNPKEIESRFRGSNSAFELDAQDVVFMRNVLVEKKEVLTAGNYPVECTGRRVALQDSLRKMLPIGQYRTFKLDHTNCKSLSAGGEEFVF